MKTEDTMDAGSAQPTITLADVEQTFGPVCAKLAAEHDRWPDEAEVRYRLGLIAKYGKRRLRGILAARNRFEARQRAARYREVFGGSGKAA